jgi:hypothetical protein
MKTINELRTVTNSLQSMMIMNGSEMNLPAVGKFLTTFYYTDRRSELIIAVDGNKFTVENENEYFISKRGIQYIDWEGRKRIQKGVRITNSDISYTDPSF